MLHLKIGPKRLWIELWSRLFSFRDWDFHFEHRAALFDTRAYWFGPFHILVCDTRQVQIAPCHLTVAGGSRNG